METPDLGGGVGREAGPIPAVTEAWRRRGAGEPKVGWVGIREVPGGDEVVEDYST